MRPPFLYRCVLNPLRAWLEDRRVPDHAYVDQWRAVWRTSEPGKVRPFLNLRHVRRSADFRRVGERTA